MLRWRETGRVSADLIPLFHEGEHHLFFLNGYDEGVSWARNATPWGHITTDNLVNYKRLPDAITPGRQGQGDGLACFTGSVIVHKGVWHIFYTGFSPLHPDGRERILHATSEDGVAFAKDTGFALYPDRRYYGCDEDWRDPFVFWNKEEGLFCMTITAGAAGPSSPSQRGVVGLAKSADLQQWQVFPPIYSPGSYMPMECTDLFFEAGRWYMLFSQYGHTEYRWATSLYGPWNRPANPILDGGSSGFYAAKTSFDGGRRLLWGWCGTSPDGRDSPGHLWGGDIVSPRELYVSQNGELALRLPQGYAAGAPLNETPRPARGNWQQGPTGWKAAADDGLALLKIASSSQNLCLRVKMRWQAGAGTAGIWLCCPGDLYQSYRVQLDVGRREIEVLRDGAKDTVFGTICDGPRHMARQALPALGGKATLTLLYAEGVLEVFVDDTTAMTVRLADLPDGAVLLAAEHITTEFETEISAVRPVTGRPPEGNDYEKTGGICGACNVSAGIREYAVRSRGD